MRSLLILLATLAQFAQRPSLSPAETLLEPLVLRAIDNAQSTSPTDAIKGSNANAGEIWITCSLQTDSVSGCPSMQVASGKLRWLVEDKGLERPARTIRFIAFRDQDQPAAMALDTPNARNLVKASIYVGRAPTSPALQVFRSPWSRASIADEVVELFARQAPYGSLPGTVEVRPFHWFLQPVFDLVGVPTLALMGSGDASVGTKQTAFVVAAAAYFLATMPNAGSEALLSHLTVGAHTRLAEDGRRAVAQMGNQQRAGAEVLTMLTHAIEREQRRMRSFERYMPEPVDPILRSRLADMEMGITSVWTSLGITSSPFVPAADRIRGRGTEDRRVVSLNRPLWIEGPLLQIDKLPNAAAISYELINFIDGKRTISDIRDAVSAEFGPVDLPVVVQYLEALATLGSLTIR